jgi:hypothetical protein
MTSTIHRRRAADPANRLISLAGRLLVLALAACAVCCTTLTSVAAAAADSPCSGFGGVTASCSNASAVAGTSDGEAKGEPEEGEDGEGVASTEAIAEEAGTSPPSNPGAGANVVVLSHLKLTSKATAALEHHQPSVSTVQFSFTLSAPAKVRVTLFKQTAGHGRKQWAMLPDSLTTNVGKGLVSRSLTGHNRLSPGRYRLTVKPLTGSSRSIYLSARR